jgi:hypothetical protein
MLLGLQSHLREKSSKKGLREDFPRRFSEKSFQRRVRERKSTKGIYEAFLI